MIYLIGGFALLLGLLLLMHLAVTASPAGLARGLKWTALTVGLMGLAALTISGRLGAVLLPIAMLMPLLSRLRSWIDRIWAPAGRAAGQSSDVESRFLRMSLDHETGIMSGTVREGRFVGMRLQELGTGELLSLLRECRAEDEQSARLLEAYLDRYFPDWRDELAGETDRGRAGARKGEGPGDGRRAGGTDAGNGASRPSNSGQMGRDEAYGILGLQPGADEEAIKTAHRSLMKKFHPDHGGTDYLATQINRARDVLLGH